MASRSSCKQTRKVRQSKSEDTGDCSYGSQAPRDQRRLIVRGIGTSKVSCTRESASKRGSGGNYGQSETMRHARRTQRSRQTRRFRQYDGGRIESFHTNQLG